MPTTGKTRQRPPRKDPKGGLTAEGRKHFKETEGAHLRPGVKVAKSPEDMKRKGSFLRRFYGRKATSPLTDIGGEPTRYAKAAAAWGEKVPKTQADVERLARKGTALLEKSKAATGGRARTSDGRPGVKGRKPGIKPPVKPKASAKPGTGRPKKSSGSAGRRSPRQSGQ